MTPQSTQLDRSGLLWGTLSYFLWGFFPVYWKLLKDTPPIEILAHRMAWVFVFYVLIFVGFSDQKRTALMHPSRRDWLLSAVAGFLIMCNWGVYIYAVNTGHILEGSLAYFINPILNVAVGVFFFKEPFPMVLKLSVGFAALGVLIKVGLSPSLPWISLFLAGSFCVYGITKKTLKIPALTSSVLEATVGFIPAVFAIYFFQRESGFSTPMTKWLLFAGAGAITGLPLFLFSYAAQRLPYSIMGILQFIAPTLQFLVAVVVFNEPLTQQNLLAFGLIWIGMLFYLAYQVMSRKREVKPL
ncbi:MAG: EamA family transporter RarD [Bdellovibrionales bacterium]|nr:EamA family transporter RarD [Bdellovibrionales bacterium]